MPSVTTEESGEQVYIGSMAKPHSPGDSKLETTDSEDIRMNSLNYPWSLKNWPLGMLRDLGSINVVTDQVNTGQKASIFLLITLSLASQEDKRRTQGCNTPSLCHLIE